MLRQSTAGTEHVAQSHFLCHIWIVHLKARIMLDNWVIPANYFITDHACYNRGCNWLGERSYLKNGISIDRLTLAYLPYAESLEIQHLVMKDDCDRYAGDACPLHGVFHILLQFGNSRLDLFTSNSTVAHICWLLLSWETRTLASIHASRSKAIMA